VPVKIVLITLLSLCSYLDILFFWLMCYNITEIQTLLSVFITALISLCVLLNAFLARDVIHTSRAYATMSVSVSLWLKCIGTL